ncbi:MAG: hypothetical protein CMF46_01375 [Legionellales bacterium]|nr:hypothetical protein [Legionellales bacterium]
MSDRKLRLNMRDLDYLRQLAINKNFTTAAKQCLVSQPTLSTQIRKIEDHLGVTIFERDNKNVSITAIGEKIIAQANRVLACANQLHTIASAADNPLTGNYHIGIIPTISTYLLPEILTSLKTQLKDLSIIIHEEKKDKLIAKLEDGTLDAVIAADIDQCPSGIKKHKLYQEKLELICSSKRAVTERPINTHNLINETLLMLDHGDCLRDKVIEITGAKPHQIDGSGRSERIETIISLVEADHGISFVPSSIVDTSRRNIHVLNICNQQDAQRNIDLLYRARSVRKICSDKLAFIIRTSMSRKDSVV